SRQPRSGRVGARTPRAPAHPRDPAGPQPRGRPAWGANEASPPVFLLLRAAGSAVVPTSCRVGALRLGHPAVAKCLLSLQVIDLSQRGISCEKGGITQSFGQARFDPS